MFIYIRRSVSEFVEFDDGEGLALLFVEFDDGEGLALLKEEIVNKMCLLFRQIQYFYLIIKVK